MKKNKSSKKRVALAPVRMTIVQRADAASKQLATVEANVAAYRVAALGDSAEPRAELTGGLSLEGTVENIFARLEVLARETARINRRIGQ